MPMHVDSDSDASEPLRVLVVDDSPEGLRGLSRLLEIYGFEVHSFGNGVQALEFLRNPPVLDAVLTDLFLPDVDGREIGAAAFHLNPRPFIGLVTGWTRAEQDDELNVPYFDEVFLKPINIRQVVETLREQLPRGSA